MPTELKYYGKMSWELLLQEIPPGWEAGLTEMKTHLARSGWDRLASRFAVLVDVLVEASKTRNNDEEGKLVALKDAVLVWNRRLVAVGSGSNQQVQGSMPGEEIQRLEQEMEQWEGKIVQEFGLQNRKPIVDVETLVQQCSGLSMNVTEAPSPSIVDSANPTNEEAPMEQEGPSSSEFDFPAIKAALYKEFVERAKANKAASNYESSELLLQRQRDFQAFISRKLAETKNKFKNLLTDEQRRELDSLRSRTNYDTDVSLIAE